jgi:hypothetical protein
MKNFLKYKNISSKPYESNIDQIKSGDFNGDGFSDFIVTRINRDLGTTPAPLQVYLGDGQGNFSDQTANIFKSGVPYVNFVPRMIVADFNNDGISDIFCVDNGIDKMPFSGGQNKLFLSSSNNQLIDATSQLPQGLKNNHGASIGDINQDGRLDILVNALMSDGNDLQVQNNIGQFISSPKFMPILKSPSNFGPQTNTWSGLIDVNKDKYPDMILGTWDNIYSASKFSQVFLNNKGDYSSSSPINLPSSQVPKECVLDIKPIDLNGDDLPDLALSITNGGDYSSFYKIAYIQLLINDGDGNFHDETSLRYMQGIDPTPSGSWYKSIEMIDINHDGFTDMVLDNNSHGAKLLMNDGGGNFSESSLSQAWQNISVADINNDGMSDLIISENNGSFSIYLNTMTNSRIYKANFGGDMILGSSQNDLFISSDGNDKFIGNGGIDVVQMNGEKINYTVNNITGGFIVNDENKVDGTDTFFGISRIQFSDKITALDINGTAGQVYRLYQAAFDRLPDKGGLGDWIYGMDHGMTLLDVSAGFVGSDEFKSVYGLNPTNSEVVTRFYKNVLHRDPEQAGFDYWMNQIVSGSQTRTQVLTGFSESPENQLQVIGVIQNGIEYTAHII